MTYFAKTPWIAKQTDQINLGTPICDIYAYGTPIYLTTPNDPHYTVTVANTTWGPALEGLQVPIPAGAIPASGDDHWICIADPINHLCFALWHFDFNNGAPTCDYGTIENINGSPVKSIAGSWTGGGAGISMLAMTTTIADLQSGSINHPMKFGHPNTAPSFIFPAQKSDGKMTDGMPMGTFIQLAPGIDLSTYPLTPFESMIGKCLQTWGAYLVDTAATFSFDFETPTFLTQAPDWYKGEGIFDYQDLPNLPWDSLVIVKRPTT